MLDRYAATPRGAGGRPRRAPARALTAAAARATAPRSIGFIWSLADLDDEQLARMTMALYGDCLEEGEAGAQ